MSQRASESGGNVVELHAEPCPRCLFGWQIAGRCISCAAGEQSRKRDVPTVQDDIQKATPDPSTVEDTW